MAQIALSPTTVARAPDPVPGSPLYHRHGPSDAGPVELLPNPNFVFPQREPASAPPATAPRRMSLQPVPAARRGSTGAHRQQSVSALPDFSFHPSGPSTSPPASPLGPPSTPRTVAHRRGGSEFIGGDGRPGQTSVLSSSPTKGQGFLPTPSTSLQPPTGRRGHAHRRSGAISSHDLSSIMRPDGSAPSRAGSAPTTPLEGDQFFGHTVNKSISQPSLHAASARDGLASGENDLSHRRPPSRSRVEFSDKVEYIRPLSTISSETESSMSTVRGHSKSGSLSSIASPGAASPRSVRSARTSLRTTFEEERRPSTAGAILDAFHGSTATRDTARRPRSAILPSSSEASTPDSPMSSGRRRSFFRLDARRSDPTLPAALSGSASDPAMPLFDSPLPSPSSEVYGSEVDAKLRKASSTPRKVKTWANSIISKKAKAQGKIKNRPPTPPPASPPPADDDDDPAMELTTNFDVENTVTIVTPTSPMEPNSNADAGFPSWRPQQLKRQNSDSMSPVIDLDAALGPFNTPNGASPRIQQRNFAAHRRAMHSAGLVVHHRRTESAPELIAFEQRTGSVGSASAMDDVFEEEEEDEQALPAKAGSAVVVPEEITEECEEPELSIGVKVVEAEGRPASSGMNWNFNNGLGISADAPPSQQDFADEVSCAPTHSSSAVACEEPSPSDSNPVQVVGDDEEPRTSSLTRSSDSTVTPTMDRDVKDAQPVMNLSIPLPQPPLMTPDTLTASSISSPDFRSSQASFDIPRLGTAASSLTDYRAMPSPYFGEPGPELRVSVDDVPSLTSSRSTTTSALQNAFPLVRPRRLGDRSSSLSSMAGEASSPRRKRSSIASLSRLINSSSLGEKSKLNIEQRPQSAHMKPTKDTKSKKHKRLSKLMQFWKPKDVAKG